MRSRTLLTLTLLGLIVGGTIFALMRQFSQSRALASETSPPADGLVVYYFNGNFHCPTCDNFETYTRKTLQSDFAEPMGQGRLQWRVVNVDLPANRHFIPEYRVISRTIVLATFRDGKQVRSRTLDRIWDLVGNEGDFTRYIHDEVAAELRGVAPRKPRDIEGPRAALLLAAITALWMGVCASIAPCPLGTNILAISFLAKQGGGRGRILVRSLAYAVGGMLAYAALSALAVWGVLNVPVASQFLQKCMNKILWIILILVGMVLTGLLKPQFRVAWRRCLPPCDNGNPRPDAAGHPAPKAGAGPIGAAVLGMFLALSFCPTTAWLFFGGLLPIAIEEHSPLLLPSLYGLGAALPVVLLGSLLAGGTQLAGKISGSFQAVEKWTRLVTGTLFIAIGIWFCLRNAFGLF